MLFKKFWIKIGSLEAKKLWHMGIINILLLLYRWMGWWPDLYQLNINIKLWSALNNRSLQKHIFYYLIVLSMPIDKFLKWRNLLPQILGVFIL